ncbi:hypothetical protein [Fontimonas sp. SYSU GA230001]|uniref:hypothetical protein n=1 Tax=Fontimonas sp. SYSU GA230001 TaxID=3142450 RepID=UPI0032B5CCA0
MISDTTEPRNLKQILSQNPQRTGGVITRAQRLADINRSLRDWCDEPWVHQVRIANIRGDTAVLYASSAPALLRARQRQRALLAWLKTRHLLSCTRIEAKVRPPVTGSIGRV